MRRKLLTVLSLVLLTGAIPSMACTNFLITRGASVDGSTMISYAADSHVLYGELYHWPAKEYPKGTMLKIYEWDTGKLLGEIPQAARTYNVVGNTNEFQVSIGETTYGGRDELTDSTAIMDYGSLIYIALQRSKTAREAIKIMVDLMNAYGYYSSGESFSVADKNEVWIFEVIGKGVGNKGAVWVAMLVPDGYVCAHANQARITTFPYQKVNKWDDPKATVFCAPDVISFARTKKYFSGKDEEFSFSDTYAPVDFSAARFSEIRVWAFFNSVSDGMDKYWEYAKGNVTYDANGYATNRMPLWVKPNRKISVLDVMDFMRDHLEGTELDMTKDVGAGPFGCPYRWRPLTFKVDGETYVNERATATQQTGFSFIAQMRSWLPDGVGCINWFGVDDAASCVYMPVYSSITNIPLAVAHGNGSMMEYSETAAFWVFNLVSNFAYTRWNLIHPEIRTLQRELETRFVEEIKIADEKAMSQMGVKNGTSRDQIANDAYNKGVAVLNEYTNTTVQATTKRWHQLWIDLFVKYMDGNVKVKSPAKENYLYVTPSMKQPGYGDDFYKLIIEKTGDKLKMKGHASH